MQYLLLSGAIYNSTTSDELGAAFSYETMNSFRFLSRVRLEQTSMTADTSDSYSVSAACKQSTLELYHIISCHNS